MLIRIGSRGSRLALTQAELAATRLRRAGVEIALVPITTAGDRDRTRPFGEIGARGWTLTREVVERSLPARKGRPLFLIDLAVPRDLDPAIHELDGCYLYDIDDLEAVVVETLADRSREAQRAETIVAEEANRFRAWSRR